MESSLRPKARPKSLTKKKKKLAPSMSLRPKARPMSLRPKARPMSKPLPQTERMQTERTQQDYQKPQPTTEEGAAIERGNRAAQREAYDQRTLAGGMAHGGKVKKMMGGGKIRGYGMARGGKVCKMR
jgi:hypothetical protein